MKFLCQKIHKLIIAGCALFLFPIDILATTYQVTQVVTGLGIPWGMSFQSENEILFTERKGRLGIVNIDSGEVNYLSGLPDIIANGQGGFMDVVKPTNNEIADWTYFTYVKPIDDKGNGETTLARANISSKGVLDWQDLMVTHSLFGGVIFDVIGVAWGSDRQSPQVSDSCSRCRWLLLHFEPDPGRPHARKSDAQGSAHPARLVA
jgi:hypothetical protein